MPREPVLSAFPQVCRAGVLTGLLALLASPLRAQAIDSTGQDLSTLDIEELARVKVTSVTRRPESIAKASAAVTVVSREDIRRSGAASLPEALRLLPGLAVVRQGTRDWSVSSRGFIESPNKMLVLVDGRVVYSPIFAGVFWDAQRVPLEDIDRIELIRGPGAALWGANAVNGVINVVTRSAAESRGGFAEALGGSNDQAAANLRYGTKLGSHGAMRVYGMGSTQGASDQADGDPDVDDWQTVQGGFRADLGRDPAQTFTVQGDAYGGEGGQRLLLPLPSPPFTQTLDQDLRVHGGNVLGRWTRRFSGRSDLALQSYFDYAVRSQPALFGKIAVKSFDLDFQHHYQLNQTNNVTWGLGYRLISDDIDGAFTVAFVPPGRTTHLVTGFVQDEMVLVRQRLGLSLGSKFEHNSYTGFELQPTVRLFWTPSLSTTFWGAVSRAVRTPSRVDSDALIVAQVLDVPPVTRIELRGSEELEAEALTAYEVGYRMVPHERLSLDVTAYYDDYRRLRSFTPGAPDLSAATVIVPYTIGNDAHSRAWGGTASATVRLSPRWRMRGSYTYLNIKAGLNSDAPAGALPDVTPGLNPTHQASLWSSTDLPENIQLDLLARYVGVLRGPGLRVPPLVQADVQVGLRLNSNLGFAVVGRDLFSSRHLEFIAPGFTPAPRAIERQVRARMSWRF
jgi:iron complex outermembrane receptor protein